MKVYTALHNREGLNVFDWPGNSADLTPIEEVWNSMQKRSGKLANNKKQVDQRATIAPLRASKYI